MFGALQETKLAENWMLGTVLNTALVPPVVSARMGFYGNEKDARSLWSEIGNAFERWKLEQGESPQSIGLLGLYADTPIADCPPYVCAGVMVRDYVDLLNNLGTYAPLVALQEKHGRKRLLAALILSQAAAGLPLVAIKAHQQIEDIRKAEQAEHQRISNHIMDAVRPYAERGLKFSGGGKAKRGKEQEPKASIRRITERIGSRSFDNVLAALRDADQCADLYESTQAPIGVLFSGVDDDNETIEYLKRGDLSNNSRTITFARLRNILSELK